MDTTLDVKYNSKKVSIYNGRQTSVENSALNRGCGGQIALLPLVVLLVCRPVQARTPNSFSMELFTTCMVFSPQVLSSRKNTCGEIGTTCSYIHGAGLDKPTTPIAWTKSRFIGHIYNLVLEAIISILTESIYLSTII